VKNIKVSADEISFSQLVNSIQQAHAELSAQASKAVNASLTLRNWLIGLYIFEYELNGSDRADYGKKVLEVLSEQLSNMNIPRTDLRELRRYRQFYESYPQIGESLTPQLQNTLDLNTVGKRESLTPVSGELLISSLSFTHISSLLQINDHTKRAFYEIESIRGNWSVRELKRQINSLYFERSGLSIDKEKLSAIANQSAEKSATHMLIRDPYVFEFLGLKAKEVMSESQLEDELLKNIEEFLLELGHGFCFEGRQKRILIGEKHYFVDLVFYHRILKCHVLVELKLAAFSHENIGQLNTYVNWYKKNMMVEDDNPPIGILLCTDKDHALMEYALAGMDEQLFVSKYQLALPCKADMQKFIEDKLGEKE